MHPGTERSETKRKDEERKAGKRKATKRKRRDDVKELREQFGHEKDHFFANFNKEQCGKYLQYKKKGKEDGKMPEDLEGSVSFGWIALHPRHLLTMTMTYSRL